MGLHGAAFGGQSSRRGGAATAAWILLVVLVASHTGAGAASSSTSFTPTTKNGGEAPLSALQVPPPPPLPCEHRPLGADFVTRRGTQLVLGGEREFRFVSVNLPGLIRLELDCFGGHFRSNQTAARSGPVPLEARFYPPA